ncbi:hypothetical protein QR680_012704 [Steinernema hermaphroditum]|uniref:Uncharacterized protein n=1 Tax=Steinernema hermaphroditum TaxID=289476 RepID=A0AA39M168_9BILA|nr:hypothetical protein QR680_012704 [Steinernema hermaphroditum]
MGDAKADFDRVEPTVIEPYQVGLVLGSIVLFLNARRLVRSTVFYYLMGCLIGVFSSVFLLVYVLTKLLPMRLSTATTGTVLAGYAFSSYVMYNMWGYVWSLIVAYQTYFTYYVCSSASFALLFCYWQGPPSNPRTYDVMQWTLQLISTLTVYLCLPDHYVSLGIIAPLLLVGFIRGQLIPSIGKIHGKMRHMRNRWFPTPRELLTQEEYDQEADEYTRQELEHLRDLYRSPDSSSFKVLARCKNPRKLARFVEGADDHISELEASEYSHVLSSSGFDYPRDLPDDDDEAEGNSYMITDEEWELIERERARRKSRSPRSSHLSYTVLADTSSPQRRRIALSVGGSTPRRRNQSESRS